MGMLSVMQLVCSNEYLHNTSLCMAGLQSARVGDQCEAIVKFPILVDGFPFPVVINTAFLKLAEVFRTG